MKEKDPLSLFLEAKLIGPLQSLFVETLERLAKQAMDPAARVAIAFASVAPTHGHVAANLKALPKLVRLEADEETAKRIDALIWPAHETMRETLADCPLVRGPEDERPTPLVLDGDRLYLDRFFLDERLVFDAISERLEGGEELGDEEASMLRATLDRLFPEKESKSPEQKRAVATALLRKLTVVTGGPGTGKTTTVVRLLAALLERAGGELRIGLMAPTGKAAARMSESIRGELSKVDSPYREKIAVEARTLHRALGVIPNKPGRFRHDADNPMPYDVVVVDEASMIDLPLMARLLEALPRAAHLVLLGDRDQLASVNAGAVLGELCGKRDEKQDEKRDEKKLSKGFVEALSKLVDVPSSLVSTRELPPIADAVVELRHSHRFDAEKGIGRLAKAINAGKPEVVMQALSQGGEVEHIALAAKQELPKAIRDEIVKAFETAIITGASDPAEGLKKLLTMRVLCAHRRGARGVETLNRLIVEWLAKEKVVDPKSAFFHGRLVMVTENDYGSGLFNGDIGLVLREKGSGPLRVYFESSREETGVKALVPSALPAHETAFAMTIHKSQGSEFDHAVVILPDERSPIVTRELVYTGVTRAKKKVTLVANDEVLRASVQDVVERCSGLGSWLWD